jgi:hypothetical protein
MTTNPFQLEAVATYGQELRTCEGLSYMQASYEHLFSYLEAYPVANNSFGACIGLAGAHGSGKTHLLAWLSQKAHSSESLRVSVVYAKADSPSLVDLYKQIILSVDRRNLIELYQEALKNVAVELVGEARATESIGERISSPDDLHQLFKEQNLDPEQMDLRLRTRFSEAGIRNDFIEILLQTHSPNLGEIAFRWLVGEDVADAHALGVVGPMFQTTELEYGAMALVAIDAIEAIAALHRLAGRPLILLVDQLEVLSRSPKDGAFFSLLKKLIEQVGRQHALLFLAGDDYAWDRMPRDVGPRMRTRTPIAVGRLTVQETALLLSAYLDGPGSQEFQLDGHLLELTHELSGGTPREILRIAYHVYELTNGRMTGASETVLLRSADLAGSIRDRQDIALAKIDSVLRGFGTIVPDFQVGHGLSIDRLLRQGSVTVLGIVVLRATDKLAEIGSARKVNAINKALARTAPECRLLVVSLGYTSKEIRDLLKDVSSTVLVFHEETFMRDFRQCILGIVRSPKRRPRAAERATEAPLQVDLVSEKIMQIEMQRRWEVDNIQDNWMRLNSDAGFGRRLDQELQARSRMLKALDQLQDCITVGDTEGEAQLVRSLLVINDSQLQNPDIRELARIYSELLISSRGALTRDAATMKKEIIRNLQERVYGPLSTNIPRHTLWITYAVSLVLVLTSSAFLLLKEFGSVQGSSSVLIILMIVGFAALSLLLFRSQAPNQHAHDEVSRLARRVHQFRRTTNL